MWSKSGAKGLVDRQDDDRVTKRQRTKLSEGPEVGLMACVKDRQWNLGMGLLAKAPARQVRKKNPTHLRRGLVRKVGS